MEKKIYLAISADIVHSGHINIIKKAMEYGRVIVGVLTDSAVASYKRPPILDCKVRKLVLENITGVSEVVEQSTVSYKENIEKIKPDYVIHGDEWKMGIMSIIRQEVIDLLNEYGAELIEVPYTKNISTYDVDNKLIAMFNTPDARRSKLKQLLMIKPYLRAMEASNGLSGIIVENTRIVDESSYIVKESEYILLKKAFSLISNAFRQQDINNVCNKIKALIAELGLNNIVLKNEEDIEILVKSVNAQRLENNPIMLDENDLEKIYRKVFV